MVTMATRGWDRWSSLDISFTSDEHDNPKKCNIFGAQDAHMATWHFGVAMIVIISQYYCYDVTMLLF